MDNLPVPIVSYSPVQNKYIVELENAIRRMSQLISEMEQIDVPEELRRSMIDADLLLSNNLGYYENFATWAGWKGEPGMEIKTPDNISVHVELA